MFHPASDYPDDVTVYLVVNDFGKFARAFVETDIAEADRETVIRNFLSGAIFKRPPRDRLQYGRGLVEGRIRGTSRGRCWSGHSTRMPISQRIPSCSSTGT